MNRYLHVLVFAAVALAAGAASIRVFGQSASQAATATAPATKPTLPACCGDACKKMGAGCCKNDANGKTTCSMGGSCCIKPETKPTTKSGSN